jgi:hypothetical protein
MSIDELVDWRVRLHAVNDKYKGYNKKQWESSSANGSSANGSSANGSSANGSNANGVS